MVAKLISAQKSRSRNNHRALRLNPVRRAADRWGWL